MHLFEEKYNMVNVYKMEPDKEKVLEFQKKHLELIKTILVYSPLGYCADFLASLHCNTLGKDMNDPINFPQIDPNYYVEITNYQELISQYLYEDIIGSDSLWHIILDINKTKGKTLNQNCKQYGYIFKRGNHTIPTPDPCNGESILLIDEMEPLTVLLYESMAKEVDINELYNPQNIEIYSLFNYQKIKEVNKNWLKSRFNFYEENTEKSSLILSLGRKAKGVKSNSTNF